MDGGDTRTLRILSGGADEDHHYSPLWLKTTGESVYRFDRAGAGDAAGSGAGSAGEPIYETLYPLTCCRPVVIPFCQSFLGSRTHR